MDKGNFYKDLLRLISEGNKGFAVLIDPDHFDHSEAGQFVEGLPKGVTHLFVGGSKIVNGSVESTIQAVRKSSRLPVFLFPGDVSQITPMADCILFSSLISGRNPEYLIDQQVRAIKKIKGSGLEVIPLGYILVDGGNESAVQRVSKTIPIAQNNIEKIVDTALAGELLGFKMIYLEAGSGAKYPVKKEIIRSVKKEISIPLIVGGGIRSEIQKQEAYGAGADLVVMGTYFEKRKT